MKKNKIEVINGYGKIKPNKVVSVENEGTEWILKQIIL